MTFHKPLFIFLPWLVLSYYVNIMVQQCKLQLKCLSCRLRKIVCISIFQNLLFIYVCIQIYIHTYRSADIPIDINIFCNHLPFLMYFLSLKVSATYFANFHLVLYFSN